MRKYDNSAKVAFEAPRFWEGEQIYGGLSFGGTATGAVWYPSTGYQSVARHYSWRLCVG